MTTENGENELLRQLVLRIARALADHSDAVTVEIQEENGSTTLKVRTAQADLGKLIGKQGRTATSIRTIVEGAGTKLNRRYAVDIQQTAHQE